MQKQKINLAPFSASINCDNKILLGKNYKSPVPEAEAQPTELSRTE
jgi:hypothetical protein